jgi:hypothetical protein
MTEGNYSNVGHRGPVYKGLGAMNPCDHLQSCDEHALHCHLWPAQLYNIFPHYLANGTTFKKKVIEHKMCVLIFSTTFVIERVTQFVYLGSIIDNTGGTEVDITTRIRKAQAAFGTLNKIWHSTQTKLRIFNTNVKAVPLYGCETWKNSKRTKNRLAD